MMTQVLKGEFRCPHTEGVIFGPGCFKERLREVLEGIGTRRAFLCTTASVARSALLPQVQEALHPFMVGEFTEARSHTPRGTVLRAARLAQEAKADVLVSLGGGSVIDLTKGLALVLAEGEELHRYCVQFTPSQGMHVPDLPKPKLPHLALPTTLSGAEFTGVIGITDEERREKDLYVDPKLTPRWVFLDPELTEPTPPHLWAGTGMKVWADCLETLSSLRANPYTDALALGALKILYQDLAPSTFRPEDTGARGRCQFAAFMVLPYLLNTGLGIVAGLRHQIGAGFGVPHGVASTIVLPHALRWNLPYAVDPLARVARHLGIVEDQTEVAAHRLVQTVEELIGRLGLPGRLRDVGVPQEALPGIAEHTTRDFIVSTNPRPVARAAELMEVLRAAW